MRYQTPPVNVVWTGTFNGTGYVTLIFTIDDGDPSTKFSVGYRDSDKKGKRCFDSIPRKEVRVSGLFLLYTPSGCREDLGCNCLILYLTITTFRDSETWTKVKNYLVLYFFLKVRYLYFVKKFKRKGTVFIPVHFRFSSNTTEIPPRHSRRCLRVTFLSGLHIWSMYDQSRTESWG